MMRRALALLALAAGTLHAQPRPRPVLTGYVDRTGRVVEPAKWESGSTSFRGDWVAVARGGKAGFLNLRTHAATALTFDEIADECCRALFALGPEPVRVGAVWGYADERGRMVIPPRFATARAFTADGLAVVASGEGNARREGMIDRTGRLVIPAAFDRLRPFSHGIAAVERDGRWGAVNATGAVVVPASFGALADFAANGLAAATRQVGYGDPKTRWGYVDRTGRNVIAEQFTFAGSFDPEEIDGGLTAPAGLARVSFGSTAMGYIDATGAVATRFPVGLVVWGISPNGLVRFQDSSNARWGFADVGGRVVISARFAQVGGFDATGLAPAQEGAQAGCIRADGSWAFPPRFSSTGPFDASGQAQAADGGQPVLIDRTGRVLTRLTHGESFYFQDGFAAFKLYPPQIDYAQQHFGGWTLRRTLFAVPPTPSLWPTSIGTVSLSYTTADGLIRWSVETEGWTLAVGTTVGPAADPDILSRAELNAVPATPDPLLAIWRTGGGGASVSMTPPGDAARTTQAARLARIEATRGAYGAELSRAAADLPAALAALRAAIAAQYGALSGKPCMPPQCVY